MNINSDGLVGIGTNNPEYKIDVVGNGRIRGLPNNSGYSQSIRFNNVNGGGPYSSYSSISGVHEGSMENYLVLNPGSGNVGIGITNPSSVLHVIGNRINLHNSGLAPNIFPGVLDEASRAQMVISSMYSDMVIASCASDPNYGSTLTLAAYDPNNGNIYRKWVVGQGGWSEAGGRKSFLDFSYTDSAQQNPHAVLGDKTPLTLDGLNGYVGIGTNSPFAALDVRGTGRFTVYIPEEYSADPFIGQTLPNRIFQVLPLFNAQNGDGDKICQAGSISLKAQGLQWNGDTIQLPGAEVIIEGGKSNRGNQDGASVIFKTFDAERMRISPYGNVGIGTNNPQARLHVNNNGGQSFILIESPSDQQCGVQFRKAGENLGSIFFSQNEPSTMRFWFPVIEDVFHINNAGNAWVRGVLTQASDITLKKNIDVLPYGLNAISKLNPMVYHFNQQDDSEKKHFGLVAQEVQEILPELVTNGNDGKLSLSYTELVPVLINAVKEQQLMINGLESRLNRVESLLSQLVQ